MNVRLGLPLLAAGTAILAIALAAPSSAATAATWSITPGGTGNVAAASVKLTDTATGTAITCGSVNAIIVWKTGQGQSGRHIGQITSISSGSCTGPLGLAFTVMIHGLPWFLNAGSYNSGTGTTTGKVTGLDITLSGSACAATIDGTAAGADNGSVKWTYVNSTGVLKIPAGGGNLHVYNVTGCTGLLATGDAATFTTTSQVTPQQTITSP